MYYNSTVELIKESYKDLKPNENAIVNTDQGAVYSREINHMLHFYNKSPLLLIYYT